MQLTKEQIQKIDDRLHKKGIVYWDLRTEMVDHIVSDIEENAHSNDFKIELEKSLDKLGWRERLNKQNSEGWQNTNRKYRKEYHKEILQFYKSFKNILTYVTFSVVLYVISKNINVQLFKKISLALLFLPIIPFLLVTVKQQLKKYGRSVNLDYGIFYFSFAFLIMNLPLQLIKETPIKLQEVFFILFIPFFYSVNYAGYKVYKKAISRVEKMKTQLAL